MEENKENRKAPEIGKLYITLGKRFQMLGWPQHELASKVGLTNAQINLFFKGDSNLSQVKLEEIFKTLDINVDMYGDRYELAEKAAEKLLEKGLKPTDLYGMKKTEMVKCTEMEEIKAFFDVDEKDFEIAVKSNFVDHESTYPFFKAMVVQAMEKYIQKAPNVLKKSWENIAKTTKLDEEVRNKNLPMILGAAVGLTALAAVVFAKEMSTGAFTALSKFLSKKQQ